MLRQIYRRAFVERIMAILHRIDAVTYEVTLLRGEIEALRRDLQSSVQELGSKLDDVGTHQLALEREVETVLASGWDSTALARRLATLEDRISGS